MTFKVLSAEFSHETNTFKKGLTNLSDFKKSILLHGQNALTARRNTNTELAGFLDIAQKENWKVLHSISAQATPGSLVSKKAFDTISNSICEMAYKHKSSIDGVFFALHGAMVPEFCEDGEGELLQRIRDILGFQIPIAVSLDLHAMVSSKMIDLAEIYVSFKTYPHIDMRITGRHSARLLSLSMKKKVSLKTIRAHLPMLEEINGGRDDVPETRNLYRQAKNYQKDSIFAVSVNAGFSEADVSIAGPTVLVTFDKNMINSEEKAKSIAEDLANEIWTNRKNPRNKFYSPKEVLKTINNIPFSGNPIVVADYSDNPGSGAYGDATSLLLEMLEEEIESSFFGPLYDPNAVKLMSSLSVGSTVNIDIGGKSDPKFGGGPISVNGKLIKKSNGRYVGDGPIFKNRSGSFGPSVILKVKGIEILIVSKAQQIWDQQQIKAFGIDPKSKKVLAIKSAQHFRAAFEPIASRILICDSGALATPQTNLRTYKNLTRPIFPLDSNTEYSWSS